jgi:hypothetical protein
MATVARYLYLLDGFPAIAWAVTPAVAVDQTDDQWEKNFRGSRDSTVGHESLKASIMIELKYYLLRCRRGEFADARYTSKTIRSSHNLYYVKYDPRILSPLPGYRFFSELCS